ncbi:MAG TPA: VOC family protein [Micropruina sp.]|jgi:catechol 2,3-dioxygenase-like lactoylglutathione lyase family enzyme|nr:VOC family protein [Micropruina sp.]
MTVSVSRCFVTVLDADEALRFYRDLLGLEVRLDVARGGFRWITVGAPDQPGVDLVLSNYVQGSPDDLDTMRMMLAKGSLNAVHFRSGDLDEVFARLRDAGVEVLDEPTDQPWGVRDCAVRDPAGNLIRIDQG